MGRVSLCYRPLPAPKSGKPKPTDLSVRGLKIAAGVGSGHKDVADCMARLLSFLRFPPPILLSPQKGGQSTILLSALVAGRRVDDQLKHDLRSDLACFSVQRLKRKNTSRSLPWNLKKSEDVVGEDTGEDRMDHHMEVEEEEEEEEEVEDDDGNMLADDIEQYEQGEDVDGEGDRPVAKPMARSIFGQFVRRDPESRRDLDAILNLDADVDLDDGVAQKKSTPSYKQFFTNKKKSSAYDEKSPKAPAKNSLNAPADNEKKLPLPHPKASVDKTCVVLDDVKLEGATYKVVSYIEYSKRHFTMKGRKRCGNKYYEMDEASSRDVAEAEFLSSRNVVFAIYQRVDCPDPVYEPLHDLPDQILLQRVV